MLSCSSNFTMLSDAWKWSALALVMTCHTAAARDSIRKIGLGEYGYYEVREGAHTFWWHFPILTLPKEEARRAPLVLWLQGGPGASGTGFGNFEEVGPYTRGWQPREHTWAEVANLLFVDNPVGTGFSYVTSPKAFATDNAMIAQDLTQFLRQYIDEHDAHSQPLLIFCESYGGKMGIRFVEQIMKEQKAGRLKVNLKGIALGDSWISALDYVLTWGDFLRAWSLLDDYQLAQLNPLLLDTKEAVQGGNLTGGTALWGQVEERIGNLTDNVDWYNALKHNIPDTEASNWLAEHGQKRSNEWLSAGVRLLARHHTDPLTYFMRHEVTELLGIIPQNVSWGGQAQDVFQNLAGDFMVDSIASVDAVLNAGLPVTLVNGQLDLICSTLGLEAWLPKLEWSAVEAFQHATPQPIHAGRKTTGFWRQHDNLALAVVLNAGHMIPSDQPEAALALLQRILARSYGFDS